MKIKEFQELRKKSDSELQELLVEKRSDVVNLRFSLATGALENPARLGQAKREVAQVLTLIREKKNEAGA